MTVLLRLSTTFPQLARAIRLAPVYCRNVSLLFLSIPIGVICLLIATKPVAAAILMSDDFTGTTINSGKWTETDAGGIGGATGNIQQNGSLTTTGSGSWGGNYVVTPTTFDRALGGLELEADITCANSSSIFGVGYGDPGVLTGGGESYTLYAVSNTVYFSRQNANVNAESVSTGFSCINGTPFHVRITIDASVGASVYINSSPTPAVTLSGGTFSNKGFFLSGHSGTATTIDNVVINGSAAATVPDAPTDLSTAPAGGEMGLSWTAPASNGGAVITDYTVQYKLASEPTTWTTFSDGTSTSTAATITGLTNGLSYNFRVAAVNSVGTGANSATATATPALSAPSAPLSLIAVSGESMQVSLSWTAPASNGGAVITDYTVQYKLASEPTTWTTFSDGTSTSTAATVTGLTNSSSYNFRVAAVNSVGTGANSATATATPYAATMSDTFTGTTIDVDKWVESDAGGIGGTTGSVQQNGSLTIVPGGSWATQNGVSTVATYDRSNGDVSMEFAVTRSSCGSGVGPVAMGYGDMNFTVSGSSSYIFLSDTTKWELYYWSDGTNQVNSPQTLSGISSCTNNVPTTFKLVAHQAGGASVYVNGSGSASANIPNGTFTNKSFWIGGLNASGTVSYDDVIIIEPVTGPFSPTGLTTSVGDGQVGLTWTSGGDNGASITDYVVQYKLASAGSWSTFSDGTSAATSATVTGLTNGLSYNFRVAAVNTNGTSQSSSTATATPISSTPVAPTASSVTIIGAASVGEQLTGSYTYADGNGNAEATSTFRWLRAETAGGTYSAIAGATSISYIVTSADLSKYLKFEVTPVANTSPTTGSAVLSSATAQVAEIDYINQILSTGQSLSVGVAATPALSTTQPYSNLMLTGAFGGMGAGGSFTPLIESSVETMSSGMANTITANETGNDYDVAVSLHGVSGYTYSQLKKGTGPYSTGMTQVTNAKNAAIALGRTSRVIGVTTIHGETDNYNGVSGATYQSYLEEWQNDYDTDVRAITGQSTTIPLFIDQMSSFMSSYANDATSEIPIYQLKASVDNPGEIILVAPKYFFNYSDRHHLTGASSRWLGEYYGKVIKKVAVDHESWRPLMPDSVVRSGNTIYADFHVPAGELAFDTTLVSARTNYGFEYYDSTASVTISSVEILDEDTVKVTLSGTPTGANQRLRYAYTGVPGTNTGAQNAGSAAGNLRDTDSFPSLYGNTLYNWAVHFDEPISVDTTAPALSSIAASPSTTTAAISWTTNESSSTSIDYGLTASYGITTSEVDTTPRVTTHTQSLTGLVACTTYHYRVFSRDSALNQATSTDNTFRTTGCAGSADVLAEAAETITTASGGTVELAGSGSGIALVIPSGATGTNAVYQIKQLEKSDVISGVGSPTGVTGVGNYTFDLKSLTGVGTNVTSFLEPIEITISYAEGDTSGFSESSFKIYRWDGSNWHQLSDCVVDTAANTITCTTTSFSVFSLFGEVIAAAPSTGTSSTQSSGSGSQNGTCENSKPSGAPTLFQINRTPTTATLYITPAGNPYTKFIVSYGAGSTTEQYATSFDYSNATGVVVYTVGGLDPKSFYSFKVQAANGCAAGAWGNVITTGKTKKLHSYYKSGTAQFIQKASAYFAPKTATTTTPAAAQPDLQEKVPTATTTPPAATPAPEAPKSQGFFGWLKSIFSR